MTAHAFRAQDCAEALVRGDRAALGRAITWVENDAPEAATVLAAIQPKLGRARVVGVTGAPGVGKSTLTGAYVAELRRRGRSVGVIAVDPSSAVTGGAILGDRIRMAAHTTDRCVFVRSVASRGHLGGLALAASRVVDVMDAAGKDEIVVETVGAGQSELAIADLADVTVVVCAPGLGDEIQAAKAGILEIADILVVNKSDLPHAERLVQELRRAVALASREPAPSVLACAASKSDGIRELADAVDARTGSAGRASAAGPFERNRKLLARAAGARLESLVRCSDDPEVAALCHAIGAGDVGLREAADRLARFPIGRDGRPDDDPEES